jgi:hypothetical protein
MADQVKNICAIQYVVMVKYLNAQMGHENLDRAMSESLMTKKMAPSGAAKVSTWP